MLTFRTTTRRRCDVFCCSVKLAVMVLQNVPKGPLDSGSWPLQTLFKVQWYEITKRKKSKMKNAVLPKFSETVVESPFFSSTGSRHTFSGGVKTLNGVLLSESDREAHFCVRVDHHSYVRYGQKYVDTWAPECLWKCCSGFCLLTSTCCSVMQPLGPTRLFLKARLISAALFLYVKMGDFRLKWF